MANPISEPDQTVPELPELEIKPNVNSTLIPESQNDLVRKECLPVEFFDKDNECSRNTYLWYQEGTIDYILLIIAVIILVFFIIPEFEYKYLIFTFAIISYFALIYFVYTWSEIDFPGSRRMRLLLIVIIFLLLLAEIFYYYLDNRISVLVTYTVVLLLLLLLLFYGWRSWSALLLLLPFAYISSFIVLTSIEIASAQKDGSD